MKATIISGAKNHAAVGSPTFVLEAMSKDRDQIPSSNGRNIHWPTSEEGSELVEFALCIPILMAFLFMVIETCLIFYSYAMIAESAREGTRYAIVHGANCVSSGGGSCTASETNISSYVTGLGWPNLGGGTIGVVTTFPNGDEVPPHRVKVKVTYSFPVRLPYLRSNSIALSSTSQMTFIQ